ncbi:type IX secretion system sortase PorU [bacterium]|nr:type IX secretion system sortase PorU [bacterium]
MYKRPGLLLYCALLSALQLSAGAEVIVRESNRERCVFDLTVSAPTIAEDSNGVGQASFPDAEWRNDQGWLVPFRLVRVVCPQGTSPQLDVESVETVSYESVLQQAPSGAESEPGNKGWVHFRGVEEWRGFRIAQYEVRLVRETGLAAERLSKVSCRISFVGPAEIEAAYPREAKMLPAISINGADAIRWWKSERGVSALDDGLDAWPQFDLFKLGVVETGLYQVRVDALQSQGVPLLGAQSDRVKVFGNGGRLLPSGLLSQVDSVLQENAILVMDGGDGTLDATDRILFWGQGLKGFDYCDGSLLTGLGHASPYATQNVYWIGVDPSGEPGVRMEAIPSYSSQATLVDISEGRVYLDQEQYIYTTGADQTNSGVVWYMATIDPGSTRNFTLSLENATAASGTLRLRFALSGGSLTVAVNGVSVHQGSFANPLDIAIPEGILTPGNNSLQITNASNSQFHLNFVEATFQRTLVTSLGSLEFFAPAATGYYGYQPAGLSGDRYILDVTDPLKPRVTQEASCSDSSYAQAPRSYWAVEAGRVSTPTFRGMKRFDADEYDRLRDPATEAGLIIVTYDDWYDELEPLIAMHAQYEEEPLRAVRVKLSDIFDEFSWGVYDPVAIRNFLRYAYESWRGESGEADAPRYVLFVGDGDYDYRNLTSNADDNWMPPWESLGDCTDDFYVEFDDAASLLNMMSGRWPVQSAAEVENIVEKTIDYAMTPLYGPWKNTATFVADDEWKSGRCTEAFHTDDTEDLINEVLPDYFTFKKLYQILYPFRQSSSTSQKPDGTLDLIETINSGTLLVNFMGHGNERVWTDEQLFVMERDFPLIDNGRMLPVIVAATCTWGGYDRPTERCFPELLISARDGGAIACVAATRFTYVTNNQRLAEVYYAEIFRQGIAVRRSLGEAMTIVKSVATGNRLYHTLGNPVLRLATPEYYAHVDQRDDSLQAGALFHLSGFVSLTNNDTIANAMKNVASKRYLDDDEVWTDFQGIVEARVFDSEDSAAYYFPTPGNCGTPSTTPYYYKLPGNAVFRGRSTIENGRFNVTFRVPRDIQYGGENAKVSLYFFGKSDSDPDSADGIGIERPLRIASGAASESDSIPPSIEVWLENSSFTSGDQVSTTPLLVVRLTDESGLNLSGEVGHRVSARIDDAQPEDVTPFFNYDIDSYVTGALSKTIGPLSLGAHRLTVEAWDSFNNLNVKTLDFTVAQGGEDGYSIRDVLNWPNPMSDVTYFTYSLSQEGTQEVKIKVFTLSGKLIDELEGLGTRQLYNSNRSFPWHGRDREGHELANGVYLYKVIAEHSAGYTAEATGKLVILR